MFNKHLLALALVLVTSLAGVRNQALAYGPCGPFQEPLTDAHGSICRPIYIGGELLQLVNGVPFAWIRSYPSSYAPVLTTIYPSSYATVKVVAYSPNPTWFWDGYQNWFMVHPYPVNTQIVGWIEQASLATGYASGYPPEDPTQLAQWIIPGSAQVKPGVPFLWLRTQPSSHAGIIAVMPAGATLSLLGSPSFDGVQWWWQVSFTTRRGVKTGYVEQQLIMAR